MAVIVITKELSDSLQSTKGEGSVTSPSLTSATVDQGQSTDSSSITSIEKLIISSQRFTQEANVTSEDHKVFRNQSLGFTPVDRVYPHIFDSTSHDGNAIELIKESLDEAMSAIDAYGEPDISSMNTHLTNIAVKMKEAYSLVDFNRSLASVISFLRRATLLSSLPDIDRASLSALINSLNSILTNPMMNLDEATDIVENLSKQGWKGELAVVDTLFAALLESDAEENSQQDLLFEHNQVAPQGEAS